MLIKHRQDLKISMQEIEDCGVRHLKKYEIIYTNKPPADGVGGKPGGMTLQSLRSTNLILDGAGGRNRTDMGLPPRDFESRASTNFTTPARTLYYPNPICVVNKIARVTKV
jgi:hypothetical protein